VYWLWRDRKGLLANPLSVAANVLFVYGAATSMWMRVTPLAMKITWMTLALQVLRTGVRMGCSGRIYGARFALGVPLRAVLCEFPELCGDGAGGCSIRVGATARPAAKVAEDGARFPHRAATLLSHGIEFPLIDLVPAQIPRAIARALPEHFTRKWRVLPFKVTEGSLFIAGVEPPSAEMEVELRSFTALQVRFHLMNAAVAG